MGQLVGHDCMSEASCYVAQLRDLVVASCGDAIRWSSGGVVWSGDWTEEWWRRVMRQ